MPALNSWLDTPLGQHVLAREQAYFDQAVADVFGFNALQLGLPELDARAIPHAIRHGSVFGALAAVRPGGAMVLVAPHDPLPLLAQIADREGDAVEISYLQRGPDAWRLKLARRG